MIRLRGLGYGTLSGFFINSELVAVYRYKFTPKFALNFQPSLYQNVHIRAGQGYAWAADIAIVPILQILANK